MHSVHPKHNSIHPHIVNAINLSWGLDVIEWFDDENCYKVSDRFIALFKNVLPPVSQRPYFMILISNSNVETKLLLNYKACDYDHITTIPFTIQYQNGNVWEHISMLGHLAFVLK